ncbi:concanavalin A-like lectin/glucanase domain-containing protein [Collybia nuda]|uniref:Concanavalin A-like lectin/glucanase domain-containing protein n=1 Tax=Collybia nuda TaxID=64659 RepID=A0A9P5YAU8_9AGAR|nr:concanavalin A-like lectin/glucanase domain-containing protein [Collybia nuda]
MSSRTARFILAGLLSCSFLDSVVAANYNLVKEYSGPTFFDGWTFFDHFDNLTNGDTRFVSASVAASAKLAFVDPATNHAIIKVDNTSTVPFNEKRNTVRITTNDGYGVGSVWVADMLHIPYGCSVWPAWWSQAPTWPAGGEIDTLEGVNLVTKNQMGLHTLPGCTTAGATQVASSVTGSTDCSHLANSNQGCIVTDGRPESYGAGFANAGGGVWVTEYATTGISIWFFPRANVPSSLSGSANASTIDTSSLGTPTANWPSTNCDMNTFFSPQNLIFDITLCGDFAGPPNIFNQTCTGVCYNDYVLGNGSNYATAYFEVASVKVFGTGGGVVVPGNGSSSSGATNPTGATNSTGGSTSGLNGMVDNVAGKGWWSVLAMALMALLLGL